MDKIQVNYEDELGNMHTVDVDIYQIGKILTNLENTRIQLGHKTIKSTLRYVNGMDGIPAFDYVKYIIDRENTRKS